MAKDKKYKNELKSFRKARLQATLGELAHKLGLHFHWFKEMQLDRIVEKNLAPSSITITHALAIVVDGSVVDVIRCQSHLGEALLQQPLFVKLEENDVVKPGYKYVDNKFIA